MQIVNLRRFNYTPWFLLFPPSQYFLHIHHAATHSREFSVTFSDDDVNVRSSFFFVLSFLLRFKRIQFKRFNGSSSDSVLHFSSIIFAISCLAIHHSDFASAFLFFILFTPFMSRLQIIKIIEMKWMETGGFRIVCLFSFSNIVLQIGFRISDSSQTCVMHNRIEQLRVP